MWNECMALKSYRRPVVNRKLPHCWHRKSIRWPAIYSLATTITTWAECQVIVSVAIVLQQHYQLSSRIDWVYRRWHHRGNRSVTIATIVSRNQYSIFQNWPNCILWMFVDDEQLQLSHQQQSQSMSSTSLSINPGSIHSLNSVSASNASLSSSSNSNSPTSSLKASSTSGSSSGRKNHRKVLPIKYREYDPEKHCGVLTIGGMKPCTRSLTCKTHQISLRRNVDGRSKPFDLLLAEHRNNSKDGMSKSAKQQVRQCHSLWSVGLPTGNRIRAASLVDVNTRCSFEIIFHCIRGISKHEPSTVDRFILFNCVNLECFDFMYSSSPLNICSYIRWIATIN